MGVSIQRRRGTTSQHGSFTGKAGEMTVDTTKWVAVVHDGSTVGGYALAREVHNHSNATTSVAGFMSASDKTKLDSISGGTINYQTVQANGSDQTQRSKLNLSSNFTLVDDGAGNRTSVDLSDSGVSGGTYTKVTVNAKGRVTSAALIGASDIPNITASKITDFTATSTALRLDQFASPTSDVSINSNKIINLANPVSSSDAANKAYVDATATGLTFKSSCRAASTANVNLAAPGTSIDGVTLSNGDRILIKDQTDATQNGIYIFNGASSLMTRALDADTDAEVKSGMLTLVTEGTLSTAVSYVLSTANPITLGVTSLTFVAFASGGGSVSAGNGINVTGNTVSAQTASSSRIVVGGPGIDLASTGVTAGTYNNLTIDVYGRITAATGTQYQTLNSNLTAVAGLAANGFSVRTGSGAFSSRSIQQGTGIAVTNGDGVSGNVSIAVTPDTTVQQVRISASGTLVGTRRELNFVAGSGITLTPTDNSGSNRVDLTIEATGGGGGAPSTSQYVTLANDSNLSNERVLVVGAGLNMTDGGANGNVTLAFITDWGSVP